MSVRVNEPWRDDQTRRVDHALGLKILFRGVADEDDAVAHDAHVGFDRIRPGAVNHIAASDRYVEFRYALRTLRGRSCPRALEVFVEKLRRRVVNLQPVTVQQEVMNLVGEDDHFVRDFQLAQPPRQIHSLREGHVAVVVTVNQQHRRAPFFDRADGRRFKGDLDRVAVAVFDPVRARNSQRPIVTAVQVNPGGEEVGVAGQTERRQKAAVTASPQSDPRLVNVATRTQVMRARDDVLIFRRAAPAAVLGLPKRPAVADAEAIIYRQHRIALARKILIEAVRVVVVVHVVPAEHHLPARAAVHKDHCRQLVTRLCVFRKEELAVDFEAVGSFEENWLWFDEFFRGEDILASETHAPNQTYQISSWIYLVEGRSDYTAWNECVSLKITE